MTPGLFEYMAPTTLSEALESMERLGDDAKVLAGGQSLIPLMKLRFASFPNIIDISRINGLKFIRYEGGMLRLGPMTTTAELEGSAEVAKYFPAIADAAKHIADPLIRNMGTVGGNVCHADPGNDLPAVMISLGAEFHIKSKKGTRKVNAADFFVDTFVTSIGRGELLAEISIPAGDHLTGSAYIKHKRRAGDFSVAGVAVCLSFSEDHKCMSAGIGLTSVGPKAIKARKAEDELTGRVIDGNAVKEAAEAAVEESDPADDFYGTREFKRHVLLGITAEAITLAASRAGVKVMQ
ncbi:MAG: xanthine dehydrogenase family protein subunit M [Methanomassiliicoccales archaeon]|nr:xanthine dehydrogenase family protein subunit M [Methanomassiliicoccales archaeon]